MGMVVVALLAANADWRPCDHDQINLKTNQVRRKLRQALRLLLGKPVLDGDILSLDPAKLAHLLPERLHEDRATRSSAIIQETYAEDFSCLLRVTWINGRQKQGCKYENKKFVSHGFSFTLASDARHHLSQRCNMPRPSPMFGNFP